jgi:hypothetical protein
MKPAIVAFVIAAAFVACAGPQTRGDKLEESLRFFHVHLQTGDFERAQAYVTPEGMEGFLSLHDPGRSVVVIEDFHIASVAPDPGPADRMIVMVNVESRRQDSIVVRPLRLREVWEYRGGAWRLFREEPVTARRP